ncbi:hypothetical protein AB6A40_001834 [Gnathostoma spinigerum]|uniref:Uncharacterized protein n=1 Tax=Gnathostoma spinigerum TaxID=75299 RepID=A0ABD6E554_9BILA
MDSESTESAEVILSRSASKAYRNADAVVVHMDFFFVLNFRVGRPIVYPVRSDNNLLSHGETLRNYLMPGSPIKPQSALHITSSYYDPLIADLLHIAGLGWCLPNSVIKFGAFDS